MGKEKERIQILDTAKGISIILMTVTHIPDLSKYPAFYALNSALVIFKMPLFIFISGFLFSVRLDFRHFLAHKIDGLLKPCFSALLIVAVITSIREYFHINHASPRFHYYLKRPYINLLEGFVQGNFDMTDTPLWFIFPLFITQVLFRIYWDIYQKKGWLWTLFLSFPMLCGLYAGYRYNVYFYGWGMVFLFLLYFSIGHSQKYLARKVGMKKYFYSHTAGLISAIIFFSIILNKESLVVRLDLRTMETGNFLYTFPASLSGIYLMLYLCNYIGKVTFLKNFLVNCSKASFFILAFHMVLINAFYYWYPFRLIPETPWKSLAAFLLNVPASYLLYMGVRKTPYLRLFLLPVKALSLNPGERRFLDRIKNLFRKKSPVSTQ